MEKWEKRKFSRYLGEKIHFLEMGVGAKISYCGQIFSVPLCRLEREEVRLAGRGTAPVR